MTGTPIERGERGRLDSLIAMANTVADRPEAQGVHTEEHTLPWALLFVGVAGLIVGGFAGFVLGRQGRESSAAPVVTVTRPVEFSLAELLTVPPAAEIAPAQVSTSPTSVGAPETVVSPPTTVSQTTTTAAVSTTAAPTTTVPSGPTTTEPPPPFAPFLARQIADKSNFAMYDGRSLVLSGKMATTAMIDAWAAHVDSLFDLPVVNKLSVDPSAGAAVGFISFPSSCSFAEGSTTVGPECTGLISAVAAAALADPQVKISVFGSSDSVGSSLPRIAQLSQLRAESARDVLVFAGVPASRITVLPRGANDPAGDDSTAEGRARNRRIDITLDDVRP